MDHYELLALLPGTYSEEEVGPVAVKVSDIVKKHGGAITVENALGLRKLAYPVKHQRQGFYHLIEFNAEPAALQLINTTLNLDSDVLRHLVICKREKTEEDIVREQAMAERMKAKHAERMAETAAAHAAQEQKTKASEQPQEEKPKEASVSLEDLDKKLDEILDNPDIKL